MDLEELRAFLAVAETGSYLAAATSIGMSRSTLRRKVDALEARVGLPLLEGTHRGIVLTDAGSALALEGRRMAQEMGAVLEAIRESAAGPEGTLRIVLPIGLPPHLLVPLHASLRVVFPKLRIHCRFSEDPVRERLEDVDVAAHFGERSPGTVWISHVLLTLREWLVASREYVERLGAPRSIDELARHDLLVWQGSGRDPRILPLRDGGFVEIAPRLVATDIHLVRQCAIAGQGIAYVVDGELPDPGGAAPLVPILPDRVGRPQTLRLSVPRALADVPKIRVVLAHMRALLGDPS